MHHRTIQGGSAITRRRLLTHAGLLPVATALAAALPAGSHAQAADYPAKPVRWIVPTSTGGGTDFGARAFGKLAGDAWKQSVVIDNKSGASGMIGLDALAGAAPDGYTLGYFSVSQFLDAFGRAERTVTCSCEVSKEGTVSQALHLNNGKSLNEKLRDKTSVVAKWEKLTDGQVIDALFAAALARPATADERKTFLAALADAGKEGSTARREAIEDVVWAVLTGKEFLFNH